MASIDTVNDLPPRVSYTATAGQTAFAYPFPIFEDEDLVVYVDGVLQTYVTDYSVSGAGDDTGGTVTLASALAGGEIVIIYRDIAMTRSTDIAQNGPWSSTAYNDEQDKIFLLLQQLKALLKRTIRFSQAAELADEDMELEPANFANRYLAFDADGAPTPAALSAETMTQATIGGLLYPRTAAEISAGVTPTNYQYPWGFIERYGTNTTPGTTDMSAALASASAQAAVGGADINALTICHIASETEVAGLFRVGRRQCFTATSVVTFAPGAVNAIYPEWWGAIADAPADASSGTQCQSAFEAAITASTLDGDGAVAIHPISLGPGNYRIDGLDGLLPPAFKMYGLGIHVSSFAINSGATGDVISDSGSASKVELRDFAVYCNDRAGLTSGINLGNDSIDFGTEGYISDLWVRDLPAGSPGFRIRGNVGCAGRLIAQDTGGIEFVGTAGMCEQLVNMTPKGFDVGGTNYCTNIGDTRVDSLHIEAPATNTIPLLISAKASIDTVTVSFTNGRTHSHVVEIDADATSYRIGNIFYYFQATPTATITNGNIKLADGTYIGGNASSGSHSGEGGYSSGELFTSTLAGIKAQQFTAFKIRLVNTAGTIQHRIGCPSDSSAAGSLHSTISSASTALTNTPTGADGSTAMAAGLKIGSASTHAIYFDTATQVQADFAVNGCQIVFNNTGVGYTLIPQVSSININGTTRTRLAFFLQNSTTGANVAWATALNDAADVIDIVFSGYLR